ncbi:tigger transposable element-derived protein 6-like [Gigantopelta aegis]|uniref:tigger transposable element-derived protein 6-like n=1 Tax=Gigantopelta aegis TaxID=1735272 RepID=UPI001B88A738|nr:tigger transposable element-derived protein 6-like [Gigantopelta aegis]
MPFVRKRYTVKDKLDVVGWFRRNGRNLSAAEREYGISRKQVRLWDKDYEKLLMFSKGKDSERKNIGSGAEAMNTEMDQAVFEWFKDERAEGRCVSNYFLQSKAREVASQIRVQKFQASNGWLRRWKQRYSVGIRRGTNDAQKIPSDYKEKMSGFHSAIRALRQKWDYTDYNIANMDQTMVRFDTVPKYTNEVKGAKTVRISHTGGAKKGCTVALTASANGDKRKALIIFKEKNGVIGPRVLPTLKVPDNVLITATENGWMTTVKVHHFIRHVWGPNDDDTRRLLILDAYKPHTCQSSTDRFDEYETDIVTVPGGCTGLVQPMDTHVNKVFKERIKQQWCEWFKLAKRNCRGNYVQPTRQNIIDWISVAWEAVEEGTIRGAFKSCGISLPLDGSRNYLLSSRLVDDVGLEIEEVPPHEEIESGVHFDDEDDDTEDIEFVGWDQDELDI